ncbi:MAG TPA: hypothetical protein VGO34_01730 [Alphaproteobacteria bacterium]
MGSIIFMGLITLVLVVVAWRHPRRLHVAGFRAALEMTLLNTPRVVLALIGAGFLSQILPQEAIANLLGGESGVRGILIAWLIGGFTPGGPIITFPIIVVLSKAGAGLPALVTFLTSWSVLGFQRVLAFELPMMGRTFVVNRLVAAALLPPISGFITLLLENLFE